MKYARVAVDGAFRWGIVRDHQVQLIAGSPYDGGQLTETLLELADARLLAPVTPSKIFCLGRNYQEHRTEMGYEHDGGPSVFMKGPTTIIGPGDDIVLPPLSLSTHVEHEAELAIVIGKPARFVSADDALDYILGYTCANDVSARDLQRATRIRLAERDSTPFAPSGRGSRPSSTPSPGFGCAAA